MFKHGSVNDEIKCVEFLEKLNGALDILIDMDVESDVGSIIPEYFNPPTTASEALKALGITNAWCNDTYEKLRFVRGIVMDDVLDYNEIQTTLRGEVDSRDDKTTDNP